MLLPGAIPIGDDLHIGQTVERRENLGRVTLESEDGDTDFLRKPDGFGRCGKSGRRQQHGSTGKIGHIGMMPESAR